MAELLNHDQRNTSSKNVGATFSTKLLIYLDRMVNSAHVG